MNGSIKKASVFVFGDELESFKVIRLIVSESSATDSNSVNGGSFGITVEVFSERSSYELSLISKVVELSVFIKSLIMIVGAFSSDAGLLSFVDFILYGL